MKAVDEPAYLTVGTDVSAKYRGAFCEAKIKTVKRLVKVKVTLKQDSSTQLVQDDQVKGPLRVGATVEMKTTDGSPQEAIISKLTDASWYTVVFDDGDERTLRRTSLCLKGERHFAESETLDQLPLTNPEHFGTPVIGKKTNRGRRSSLPMTEDEKEEESSEDEDEDLKRLNDELLGKIVSVKCSSSKDWFTALVVSPSCSDDTAVKKDQCLVRSFVDSKFHPVARKDLTELDVNVLKSEHYGKQGVQDAIAFLTSKTIPEKWKMDMSDILEPSSSDEEDGEEDASDGDQNKEEEEETKSEEEADPAERDHFLQQLYKFMEDRGTPINKPPVLGYKDLNLFKLFRLVYQQGGCDNIESGAVWKQIYMDLGIPILNSAASYNVKTAYKKYLYGFEEYCRSAYIQFRTIHHNDPKPVEEIQEVEEEKPMESTERKETASPLLDAKMKEEDESDSSSEYEKEETELKSPMGRRRCAFDAFSVVKDVEDSDRRKDHNKENKDIEEDLNKTEENNENESTPVRRSLQCLTKEDQKTKKQDESERESDEDDENPFEGKEDSEHKGETEEEDEDKDDLAGTKVKVKYGRGKTQKIYEANIKSTEVDGGEFLYLVHYYGWNVRYDEWVKADRIIWPSDKGGPKKKQKKKTKNKDEIDEKKEDDKRSKRGRPPLKSTLQTNMTCVLPKSPTSECKSSIKSMRNSLSDSSSLSNGLEGSARRRTRRSSGLYDSDRCSNDSSTSESESDETSEKASVKEEEEALPKAEEEPENIDSLVEISPVKESAPLICFSKDSEHSPTKPAETLKQEVEESEQIIQIYGKQTEQIEEIEEIKKEAEHLPKSKGRRSKTKDPSVENTKCLSVTQEDTLVEPRVEEETLDLLSLSPLQSKELPFTPKEVELPSDQLAQEKKGLKRKPLEQSSPDKKLCAECDPELPIIVAEEKPAQNNEAQEHFNAIDEDEELPNVNEEMPSLTAELEHVQSTRTDEFDIPLNEITNMPYQEDQDTMPTIGPENLVCHEVDLGDFDEKDKVEDIVMDKVEQDTQTIHPPTLPPAIQPHNYSVASPLALSHDESHSIKSESDITIEVDSVADESQEGLCESESANGFEASTTSSNCSITAQESEMREKGHKRMNEGLSGTLAKKQKRTPKRISSSSKVEKNGIGQSSDSEDLSTLDISSKCTPIKHPGVPKTQKIIRSPARITSPHHKDGEKEKHREKHHPHTSPRAYKWTLQLSELDNMSGTEKIVFLQEKLQEMRKYYMSLKSEVATIDRRRKRLKKKDREVSNTGASMSSGSSEMGMSPSSASPPQNTLALECR
ncbi:AT-rich interactive domain-containing protein 4A isoform X1 [Xenopus laevis]|uniref:AT-rich interactive domain-containing protein 4A isoform X1 n=1 Tax=Xenopus laevis TaxID=8355 RepID=A0A8J1LIY8_XENLA|nr:AT-rich interactive domain-containing protein 4A isoform X1 [Xenopus laevis]XP_041429045.1 AT-rich interactive domain-containing protein 4A isoform X1 [Xenopus laevis]XP_041429046.1 AT-rich interactive domain-containing protein 4A isoform X1 [Xenopus laevis]